MVSLPVYRVGLHSRGNTVNVPQSQTRAHSSPGFRLANSDVGNSVAVAAWYFGYGAGVL